jgi:hypothetical protein
MNTMVTKGSITLTVMQNLIGTSTVDAYGRVTAYTFNTDSKSLSCNQRSGFNHFQMTTWPPHPNHTPSQALLAKMYDRLEDKLCNGIMGTNSRSPKELMVLMEDLAHLRSAHASFYSSIPSESHSSASRVIELAKKYGVLPGTDTEDPTADMLRLPSA